MFQWRHIPQISAISFALLAAFPAGQALAAPAPAPPSLASALAAIKPPADGVILTVGAAQCSLPSDETFPAPGATLQAVTNTFHKTLRTFGPVSAVAPATMTLLNTRPVNANIYDGMPPQDAMKFLAATLTQGQWQQLKGDQGLGLPDMVSETQRGLFTAILPQKLQVAPQTPAGAEREGATPPLGTRDLTASLPQVRLRLRRRLGLMVQAMGSSSYMFAEASREAGQGTRYRLVSDEYFSPKSSLYGVPVKAEAANTPKPGDLALDSPALRVVVPLTNMKTVGALLARLGKIAGLELYADRRWEGRALTVLGAPSAPAADILRSLAFCLTGTYRRVGSAYVLTDDVLGAGSRRAALSEFEATASAMRQRALYAAGDSLAGVESLTDLPLAPDSLTYSAAQKKEAAHAYAQIGFSTVTQTLDQLTPEQRAAVAAAPAVTGSDGVTYTPDLAGEMIVSEDPALELLVPTLDGPVDSSLSRMLFTLFQPSPPDASKEAAPPAPISPGGASPMPLATLIKPIPSRAVLASPHTAAEVQDLVAAMKKLGLNQLWLPVVPASAPPDNLAPALQATKGTGIAVYAVVDLLARPRGIPADAADLTLLGRTSTQAQASLAERKALAGPSPFKPVARGPAVDGVAVSPFSAAVGKDLQTLTHTLATTPGIAGIVWRATAPPGYDEGLGEAPDRDSLALGYTPPARLAFLRREHVDPIDLFPASARGQADTSLPDFDDAALENTLETKWERFRADADRSLLTSLFRQIAMDEAALPSKPLLLVQQRGLLPPTVTWYGSWDRADAPLPAFQPSQGIPVAEKVQARAQSKITVVDLPVASPLAEDAILRQWSGPLQSIGKNHSWDGFVLDCLPR